MASINLCDGVCRFFWLSVNPSSFSISVSSILVASVPRSLSSSPCLPSGSFLYILNLSVNSPLLDLCPLPLPAIPSLVYVPTLSRFVSHHKTRSCKSLHLILILCRIGRPTLFTTVQTSLEVNLMSGIRCGGLKQMLPLCSLCSACFCCPSQPVI